MAIERSVKDFIIPLTDYPHIPYWFSVRQAIFMFKAAAESNAKVSPRFILVFDEKYQLLGYLGCREMLRGIEPRFLKRPEALHYQGSRPADKTKDLALLWKDLFHSGCKEEANKPVREIMSPIQITVNINDPIIKAAYAMTQTDMEIIAVLDNQKVAGVVRMVDLFQEITDIVLENES